MPEAMLQVSAGCKWLSWATVATDCLLWCMSGLARANGRCLGWLGPMAETNGHAQLVTVGPLQSSWHDVM